jgi:xanthine dehydrogenase/oxidase
MYTYFPFYLCSSSDINPILEAAGAVLELRRSDSPEIRQIPLCNFFLGDRRVSMDDDEVLVAIHIPLPSSSNRSFFRSYKQACRRDDSKGIISAGFRVELESLNTVDKQWKIVSVCFAFGGMASKTIEAIDTQKKLIGLTWTKQTINETYDLILKEMPLDEFSPGGRTQYR